MIMENNFLNDKNIEDHFKIMDPFSPKINGRDKNFQNNPFLPQDFHNDEKIQDNCFNLENDTNEIPHDFLNNLNKNQNFVKQKAKKKSFKNTYIKKIKHLKKNIKNKQKEIEEKMFPKMYFKKLFYLRNIYFKRSDDIDDFFWNGNIDFNSLTELGTK